MPAVVPSSIVAFIHLAVLEPEADLEPVLHAVRELGAERVIVVGEAEVREDTSQLTSVLEPLGVDTVFEEVKANLCLRRSACSNASLARTRTDARICSSTSAAPTRTRPAWRCRQLSSAG